MLKSIVESRGQDQLSEGNMNPGLLIFTQIAIAGVGFLLYFLYALRRESKNLRKGPKVEIRPIATGVNPRKVIQLYTVEKGAGLRKARSASNR